MIGAPSPGGEHHEKRVASLAALIRRVFREIAKSFTSSLGGTITMSDATQVRQAWSQQLNGVVLGHIRQTYMDGAGVIAEATKTDADTPIGVDLVTDYIKRARNRLVGVGDDVWLDVRAQIKLGLDAGESVQEIATRVKNVAQVPTARALTIARTETHAAYEAGAYQQAYFVGGGTKRWLATGDGKTRKTHQAANGQTVDVRDAFTVGDTVLRFPGDPLGDPSETIQCRCTTTYEFADIIVPMDGAQDLALVAAGKWNPSAHPRGNDGKFIKKGAVADLLAKKNPNILDVTSAVVDLTPDQWAKLTTSQQTYIAESVEKLPASVKTASKQSFQHNVGQSIENVVLGTPSTTKIAPNFISLLKSAKHGDVIATGTKNGKNFRVTAIKDLSRTKFNPQFHKDGVLKLEILKKDGTPSLVGGKIGDPYVISEALHDYYKPQGFKTKVEYDLKPGELHPAIADVLNNAGDQNLGVNEYQAPNKIAKAWQAVKEGHWDSLTTEQQKTLLDVTFTNGNESKIATIHKQTAEAFKKQYEEDYAKSKLQKLWDKGLITTEEFFDNAGEYPAGSEMTQAKQTVMPAATHTQEKIPAGLKGKPGDPAKVTTGVIWGKHVPDTTVLENPDGSEKITWDGKKYNHVVDGVVQSSWTKKDAYANLKADTHWVIPDAPKTTPEIFDVVPEKLPEPTELPPLGTPAGAPIPDLPVDFSDFKKVGGQAGSNPGGVYESPAGERWYVKKSKSVKHAANEVAASTFYRLAGVDVPQVVEGTGALGLGQSQTGTKLVPNAKTNLQGKLSDPAYVKQVQAGFAVDAWLANWDVAGLTLDNVVEGADGKPHRIDVGGALLFRAQGTPKGGAFGDIVTEIDTLRDPNVNPQSAQIFGSMTGEDIAESVKLVAAFDDQKIDTVVQDAGLPQSVAETLKKRRDDLVSKFLLAKSNVQSPSITVSANDNGVDAADKVFLLEEAEDQNLTVNEAVSLVNSLTADDVSHNMSENQVAGVNKALLESGSFAPGLSDAIKKWNSISAPVGDDEQDRPPLTGDPITSLDIINAASEGLTHGHVLAVTSDGKGRIIWSNLLGGFMVQEYSDHDEEWVDSESYYVDNEDTTVDEIVEVMLHDWSMYTWLKPTSGDLQPKPTTDPIPYTNESVIENWSGVINSSVKPGTVVAVTPDGKYELQRTVAGWVVNDVSSGDKKQLTVYPTHGIFPYQLNTLNPTWIVPPKKNAQAPKPENLPSGDALIPTKVAFASGLTAGKPGTTIVEGTIPTVHGAVYRLIVVSDPDSESPSISLQMKNISVNGPWVQVSAYKSYNEFTTDWPTYPFQWTTNIKHSTQPDDAQATADLPQVTAPPAPETSQAPASPVMIPSYHLSNFKSILKDNGKTGYWSKPEKIWDAVKKIQAAYPDPNNLGHSKYTPQQILEKLDGSTNAAQPNPYMTKVNKWAATAKGAAYINASPGGQTVTATQNAQFTESQLVDLVDAVYAGDHPNGTVLFTGTAPSGVQTQVVVTNSAVEVQMYVSEHKSWTSYQTVFTGTALKPVINKHNMKPTPAVQASVVTPPPVAVKSPGGMGLDLGTGDISHLDEAKKQQLYSEFKTQPATYLSSPSKNIYAALKTIGDQEGFSTLQMIRVIDDVGAKKVNKPNEHLFEKKILDWLKSPQGAAIASGQGLPKPPQPAFKTGVDPNVQLPPFEAGNVYTYNTLSTYEATAWFDQVKNKYGQWTAAEKQGLKTYTGGSYLSINPYLWGDLDEVSNTHDTAIKSAQLGMRPSLEPVLLHRGMSYAGIGQAKSHADIEKMVGQTWKSDGFMSASVGGQAAFGGNVLLEIEAPPGTPMAWVDPISLHKGENEMLLAAGLNFKIISVKKQGDGYYGKSVIRVRVIPDPTATGGAA